MYPERVWEIPFADRERWWALNEAWEQNSTIVQNAYQAGRKEMRRVFELTPELLSKTPTQELKDSIEAISSSQSIAKLLTFYNELFSVCPTPIHPETMATIITSVQKHIACPWKRAPVAPMMKEFVVHVDTYLDHTPDSPVLEPFLSLIETCIDDSTQTCIGYINSHRFISGDALEGLRDAIDRKDASRVIQSVVDFWKNDGEFADDDTIKRAYHLWMTLGEIHSQTSTYRLPLGFEEASHAFSSIMDTQAIRLIDRKRIAYFYQQAKWWKIHP